MTATLLLVAAVLLVGVGGLMAALDAALGVTSRAELVELAPSGPRRERLERIAADRRRTATRSVFIRILTETTAAVLVTDRVFLLFDNIWWAMLAAAVLMATASSCSSGRARAASDGSTRRACSVRSRGPCAGRGFSSARSRTCSWCSATA